MAVADSTGLLIAMSVGCASPHEVTLVETTLAAGFISGPPKRVIGDRAYDSDPLDKRLSEKGIELIAPHKRNRSKAATQDGRVLRRYKRRWKVERLFAWLHHFRRLMTRHEFKLQNYLIFETASNFYIHRIYKIKHRNISSKSDIRTTKVYYAIRWCLILYR